MTTSETFIERSRRLTKERGEAFFDVPGYLYELFETKISAYELISNKARGVVSFRSKLYVITGGCGSDGSFNSYLTAWEVLPVNKHEGPQMTYEERCKFDRDWRGYCNQYFDVRGQRYVVQPRSRTTFFYGEPVFKQLEMDL